MNLFLKENVSSNNGNVIHYQPEIRLSFPNFIFAVILTQMILNFLFLPSFREINYINHFIPEF